MSGAVNFAMLPSVSIIELPRVLYRERRPFVLFRPQSIDEANAAADVVVSGRGVHVLVDESSFVIDSSKGRGGSLEKLARAGRHYGATLALTSQAPSADFSRRMKGCSPELLVFRLQEEEALGAVRGWQIPDDVARLRAGFCYHAK